MKYLIAIFCYGVFAIVGLVMLPFLLVRVWIRKPKSLYDEIQSGGAPQCMSGLLSRGRV